MARLWYPTRQDIEELAYELAAELFEEYDSSLPAFTLFGGEREGGALLESALGLPAAPNLRWKTSVSDGV